MTRPLLARAPTLRVALHRGVLAVGGRLPAPVARTAAWLLALLAWFLDATGRRTCGTNLRRWLDDASTRRSYTCFALMLADACRLGRSGARQALLRRVGIVDPWGAFTSRPRPPAVVATLHANWELMAAVLLERGLVRSMASLVLPEGDPELDRLYGGVRAAYAHVGIPLGPPARPGGTAAGPARPRSIAGPTALRQALARLAAGGVLGVAVDRDYGGTGRPLPFGRARRRIPLGAAAVARRAGVPIVPVLLLRCGWDAHLLFAGRPVDSAGRDDAAVMREVLAALVPRLQRAPSQWVAFHAEGP